MRMKTLFKVVLGIFIGLFLVSGVFKLIGLVIGVTFGVVGIAMKAVWGILSSPVILILIIIILAYKLNKKS